MKWFTALAALVILFISGASYAREKILICTNSFEPYYGESMPGYGPVIKITEQALQAVGYDTEVRFSPWARVLKESQSGACDMIAAVWFDTGRTGWMVLSDALLENEIGLYKRKDDNLVFRGYGDLKSRRVVIGTVHGYISPRGFDEAGLEKEEVSEDRQNMKKLLNRRIGLALIDKQVGKYFLEKDGRADSAEWLVTLRKLPLHNAIIKTAKGDWRKRLADFNRGLRLLGERGETERILREYRLSR